MQYEDDEVNDYKSEPTAAHELSSSEKVLDEIFSKRPREARAAPPKQEGLQWPKVLLYAMLVIAIAVAIKAIF